MVPARAACPRRRGLSLRPRSRADRRIAELVDLAPDLTDDLLNTVDQPLQQSTDEKGNAYLLCDYNRDGDSYRSPWTNTYDPPVSDGVLPSARLRAMETIANDIFDGYREMYYVGGVSSVYFWDVDDDTFAACVLFHKEADDMKKLKSGNWHAIHVVEVRQSRGSKSAQYKLTTTIMLRVGADGGLSLSGTLTRQREQTMAAADNSAHVANMGRLVEDMENNMRDAMQVVYFGKTKSVVNKMYKEAGASEANKREGLQRQLQEEMARKAR